MAKISGFSWEESSMRGVCVVRCGWVGGECVGKRVCVCGWLDDTTTTPSPPCIHTHTHTQTHTDSSSSELPLLNTPCCLKTDLNLLSENWHHYNSVSSIDSLIDLFLLHPVFCIWGQGGVCVCVEWRGWRWTGRKDQQTATGQEELQEPGNPKVEILLTSRIKYLAPSFPPTSPCARRKYKVKYLIPSLKQNKFNPRTNTGWELFYFPRSLSSVGLLSSQHLSLKRQKRKKERKPANEKTKWRATSWCSSSFSKAAGRQNLSKVKENFSQGAIRRISPSPKVQSRYLHSGSFVWTKEATSLDIVIKPPALNSLLFLNDHRLAIEKDFRTFLQLPPPPSRHPCPAHTRSHSDLSPSSPGSPTLPPSSPTSFCQGCDTMKLEA
ncbi:hypothetical protein L345_06003, partial [Ophiophagus hannah]